MAEKGSVSESKSKNEFISDAESVKNKIATVKSTLKERHNLCRLSAKKLSLAFKEMRDAEIKKIRTGTKKAIAKAEATAYEYEVAFKEHKSLVVFFENLIGEAVDLYEKLIELCPDKERKLSLECEKFENTQRSYVHELRSVLANVSDNSSPKVDEKATEEKLVDVDDCDDEDDFIDEREEEPVVKAPALKPAPAVSERPAPKAVYKIPANTVSAPESAPQYQPQQPPQYQQPYAPGQVPNIQYSPYRQQYGMNAPMGDPMMNQQMQPRYNPYDPIYGMQPQQQPQQPQNVNIASATIDIAPIVEDAVAAAMEKFKASFATRADEYMNMLAASNKNIFAMEEKICEDEKAFIEKLSALMQSIQSLANEMTELSATFMQISNQQKDAAELQRKVNDMQRTLSRELQGVQVKQKVLNQDQAEIIEAQVVIQEQQKATAEAQKTFLNAESGTVSEKTTEVEAAPVSRRIRKKTKPVVSEEKKENSSAEEVKKEDAADAEVKVEASAQEADATLPVTADTPTESSPALSEAAEEVKSDSPEKEAEEKAAQAPEVAEASAKNDAPVAEDENAPADKVEALEEATDAAEDNKPEEAEESPETVTADVLIEELSTDDVKA